MSNKEQQDNRWLEIRFYYLCYGIYELKHDFMSMIQYIDAISIMGSINLQRIRIIAADMLKEIAYQPTKEELAILSYRYSLPYRTIHKYTGMARSTYNNLIEDDSVNPRFFFPRSSENDLVTIKEFMDIVDQIKEAGI